MAEEGVYPYPLVVEGEWDPDVAKLLKNKLHIYFQSKKRSNGGECIVEYDGAASNQAVVRFASEEARCNVLEKKTHQIDLQKRGVISFTVKLPSQAAAERDGIAASQQTPEQNSMVCRGNQPTTGKEKLSEQNLLDEQKTITVILSSSIISDEHLRKYFENFNTGGGPLPYFIREDRNLIVSFESIEDTQAVLRQRAHSVENIELTVKRFHRKRSNTSLQSSAVVLQNLPKDVTYEVLVLLVENFTNLDEANGKFSMEILTEIDAAVITFKTDIDLSEFIRKCSRKVLHNKKIGAKVLEKTRSLQVENLPSNMTEDYLKLYFESAKNGSGVVSSVEITLEHNMAVISFEDSEVLDTILSQAHMIDKTPVYVYPYYKTLGSALYGNKRPVVKMPDPFMVEIDCYILQFLKSDERRIAEISDEMSSCYCDIAFPELGQSNSIKISPTFSRHQSSFEKLAKNWKRKASDNLTHILSKYKTIKNDVNKSVWEIIKNDFDQYLNQNVILIPEISKGELIVTGTTDSVDILQQTFNSVVNDTIEKLDREKQSVYETVAIYPAKHYLLLKDGLESSISKQFPNLTMNYNSVANKLTLYGLPSDVYVAKSKILEKIIHMKEKQVHLDPCLMNFLQKVSCEEVTSNLFTLSGLSAACDIQDNSAVVIGSSDNILCKAEKQIRRHLTFNCIEIQDESVIRKNEWRDLKEKLDRRLNSQRKRVEIEERTPDKHVHIIISGYSDAVGEVFEKLSDFVKKNTIIQRNIPFNSRGVLQFLMAFDEIKILQSTIPGVQIEVNDGENHASVSVTGPEENVCQVENTLSNAASKIARRVLKITTPGTKQLYKEKAEAYDTMAKCKFKCIVRLIEHMEGNNDLSQFSCKVQLPNGPVIAAYKGDLCKTRVDVVVNAANEDLKHIGGLAKALLDAAGAVLQNECDWIVNQRGSLMPGEAVITEAGRLPCSRVIHAVGPRWRDTDPNTAKNRLRNAVRESLYLAEAYNFKSMAIPAISSGIFGFPLDLCAEVIVTTIREHYANLRGESTLKEIHLVNHDDKTVRAVLDAVQKTFGDLTSSSPLWHERLASGNMRNRRIKCLHEAQTKEGLNILVVKGNIQDITAAVIVNVIGMDLKLSSGAVSKAILEKAGPELEQLLQNERRRKEPLMGNIYETKGCNLDCNEVYHAIVPQWESGNSNAAKVLKGIIKDCLKNTEGSQQDSIAFPAIGTGKLFFPKDVVANIMFKVVLKFSTERRSANLKTVYFVVHPDDHPIAQAMSSEFQRAFTKQPETAVPIEQPKPTGLLFGKMSSPTPDQAEMQVGPILLQVVSGDITEETTDAIVNSSNKTFTLKSGVSKAILDAAGPTVQAECQLKGLQANSTIIITNPGKLRCQSIIHMIGQTDPNQIKAAVGVVLQACEQQHFSSVAFPAVGTGQGRLNPSQVADAMIDSVIEFIKKKPSPSLQKIRIVIFQPQMLSAFHSSMKKREESNFPENGSMLKRFTHAVTSVLFGEPKKENKESFAEDNIEFKDEIEPAHFEVCGISMQTVENTISWMEKLLSEEQREEVITSSCLFEFSEKEYKELNRLQKSLQIILVLQRNRSGAQIKICGPTNGVLTAFSKIQEMIECFREKESERRNEELTKNLVEWQFQDGTQFIPFDSATNLKLERAVIKGMPSVTIEFCSKQCEVDLRKFTAKVHGRNTMNLKRISKTEAW
ncbi:protein mono-ADP-ribosyltransferase PARP14-like isoform X2 [Pristis pectinata]|uniref:protein mono-ADP-ribosyltransferase PARP14-like isoform X2 n=1 Tax=Pristis pectinata TaxID=685728 RepID=UPI00223D0307|nr:protein mono-ADP-ribosyltransferase PARP14-like isoform X2 [Pristis pectinata]